MTIKETIKKFIPNFVLRFYHYMLALIGAVIFGFPGKNKNIKIIGVTGTSGKSTTVDFITRILEESGAKIASASSIRFKVGENEWENKYKMTMPGRFVIQKFLRQAVNAGCKFAVLEVTSEGIRQFRHKFINFDTAVFTNLSPEHIESHGGFENYRKEKLKLFKATKNIHVVNIDDENSKYFLNIPANQKIKFDMKGAENTGIKLNIEGRFNLMNAMAAISVARAYGINDAISKKALEKAKGISGRMEVITAPPQRGPARGGKSPVKVIVDYAHTPEQLEAVYKTFKEENLICVLGSCGGGRDKWKRPVLGEVAKKYCKEVIITNEDPYDENPMEIINQVAETVGFNAKKVLDRKEAIEKAVMVAKPGEVVIITGKGSEPWMCLENGKKIPWDDRKIARDFLNKINR
ncbi:MAG: UDP-N-acetylmuramoyl-L-alanyl-D-glutamate--2,6-diaminopimelate ligase [Candidatus Staskawiczbacteria bacterium]|nr:UDP-N-acetylmuramoyl-L-alanyl-D-glutamate--2,6-diaminopimelate ligase [Candidatus Staskawiczbacteria bacterium]